MAEATNEVQTELATQRTIQYKGFELPSLAVDQSGAITVASAIDTLILCLVALNNPDVDEILKANEICLRDLNGKLFFPRPQ